MFLNAVVLIIYQHHKDGPVYFPRVAIITLNGSGKLVIFGLTLAAILSFKKEVYQPPFLEVLTQPCSLTVFEDDLYTAYFHGILPGIWEEVVSSNFFTPSFSFVD